MLHVAKHVLARLAYSSLSNLSLASFQVEEYIILLPYHMHLTYQLFRVSDFASISSIFLLQPFYTNKINSPFCQRIYLLKINSILNNNCFIGFAVIFAFISFLCFKALNLLSPKIKVSFIYIPTNPKAFAIITKRQKSYNKVVIYSFSLVIFIVYSLLISFSFQYLI